MNSGVAAVDNADVASWLDKLVEALGGQSAAATPEVRRLLAEALEHRSGVGVTEMNGSRPVVMSTTLEQVRDRDMVVSRPQIGGKLRPLATNAPLRLVIDLPSGRIVAQTKSLGRIKIPSGGGGSFYGYRLVIPASFEKDDAPTGPPVDEEDGVAIEVALALPDRSNPVRGVIEELSPTGMVLRCRNAQGKIERGLKAHLKVRLPAPVGTLTERVSVVRIAESKTPGQMLVEVVFEKRLPAIADLCHRGGQRTLRRRAG